MAHQFLPLWRQLDRCSQERCCVTNVEASCLWCTPACNSGSLPIVVREGPSLSRSSMFGRGPCQSSPLCFGEAVYPPALAVVDETVVGFEDGRRALSQARGPRDGSDWLPTTPRTVTFDAGVGASRGRTQWNKKGLLPEAEIATSTSTSSCIACRLHGVSAAQVSENLASSPFFSVTMLPETGNALVCFIP